MSYYDIPDHPAIQRMERTGYPDGREPAVPICPVCGQDTDTFYKDKYGDIVGCSECINTIDAWEEYA